MDYYSTLGINRNASQDEIKKAYKKMSMQHHPDRTGGDDSKFKEINEAYQTLNNPEKKQMYDQFGTTDPRQHQYRSGDFEFNFNGSPFSGFDDIFSEMFGGQRRQRTNRPIQVAVDVSLEDVLSGKQIGMEIQLLSGRTKVVTVDVPAGVEHGQQIRYSGIGDDSNRQARPGDVILHIRVLNHPVYERAGDNIVCNSQVDVFDLMIGGKTVIKTLEGRTLDINIPAGTQPDTVLSCRGEGLPNVRTKRRGNLLIRIKAKIPKSLTQEQKQKIIDLKNGI